MSAYIIVDFTAKDPEKLKQYGSATPEILAKYQGKVLIKGKIQSLHGKSSYENKVVFQFPSKQEALGWYESPEYKNLLDLRHQGMDCQFHLIG